MYEKCGSSFISFTLFILRDLIPFLRPFQPEEKVERLKKKSEKKRLGKRRESLTYLSTNCAIVHRFGERSSKIGRVNKHRAYFR